MGGGSERKIADITVTDPGGIETHGRMLFCKEAFDWAWVCGKGYV
jgi:hypothetical protein